MLSRYNHPNERVREAIIDVLSKMAAQYPSQSAWWIFHYLFFDEKRVENRKQYSRQQFAKEVIARITKLDQSVANTILADE